MLSVQMLICLFLFPLFSYHINLCRLTILYFVELSNFLTRCTGSDKILYFGITVYFAFHLHPISVILYLQYIGNFQLDIRLSSINQILYHVAW